MKKLFASAALLAVVALATPVMADVPGSGVSLGGRLKYDFGWQVLSKDAHHNSSGDDITNFFSHVAANSYLRAVFTSPDKTTGLHLEIGLGNFTNNGNEGGTAQDILIARYAYGWYKVGSCTLIVGQATSRLGASSVISPSYISLGNNKGSGLHGTWALNGWGFFGETRNPRISLQVAANDNVGLEVSLAQAGSQSTPETRNAATQDAVVQNKFLRNTDSYLPKLEAVVDLKFGNWYLAPGIGIAYTQYKENSSYKPLRTDDIDDSFLSYVAVLPVKFNSGPFSAALSAFYAQNRDTDWTAKWDYRSELGANPGLGDGTYGGQPGAYPIQKANGEIEDTTSWGLGLALTYDFTPSLSIQVAGGFENLSNDAWNKNAGVSGAEQQEDSYTRWAVAAALPYKLTSNFTIIPTIGYYNYGDRVGADSRRAPTDKGPTEAGDEWLVGVHFQVLF
jgi:hypothetical protein